MSGIDATCKEAMEERKHSVVGVSRALLLTSFLLVLSGGLAQVTGLSHEWMMVTHSNQAHFSDAWAVLTVLGFGWPLLIIGSIYAGRDPHLLAAFVKVSLLATAAAQIPKLLMPVPRPALLLDPAQLVIVGEPVLHTGSMPSGHALATFSMLTVAWLGRRSQVSREMRQPMSLIWLALLVLGVAVAWSRVAVGAHWPADVLVGSGLGLGVGVMAWQWESVRPWRSWFSTAAGQWSVVAFLLIAACAWTATKTGYPSAVWLQWLVAAFALAEVGRRAFYAAIPQAARRRSGRQT